MLRSLVGSEMCIRDSLEVENFSVDDPDGDDVVYSLDPTFGDNSLFEITPDTGRLRFLTSPDFEAPGDANLDNFYVVQVVATDEHGLTDTRDVTVEVTDRNEAPVFASPTSSFDVEEGDTVVGQVSANDVDANDLITYSIAGTDDGLLFSVDAAGNITFDVAPDYESPNSALGTNTYTLTVIADDG